MKTLYVVRQGEYLEQIAFRHGVTVEQLWAEPDNVALRTTRGAASAGGHILAPGDVVVIPERAPAPSLSITAGEHREFVVSLPRVPVQLTLHEGGVPLADVAFRADEPNRVSRGRTNARGEVRFDVGLLVHHVRLTVEAADGERVYDLEVGGLDPLETVMGQQQRLRQLGHYHGRIAGVLDDATRGAIDAFVSGAGVDRSGWLDALRDAYGC